MKKFIVLIVILVLAAVGAGWWFMSGKANGKRVFVTDKITRGTISNTISSSGSLAALNTVEIGSQVSGQITKLYVDFNDEVQAGQLIAELDPASFEAQVLQAQANLESSRASLHGVEAQIKNLQASMLTTMADIKASEANVRKSEIALKDAERNYNRIKELHNRKLISASDLDNAETNLESQKASLDIVKANSESSKARRQSILAQMDASEADRKGAEARVRQNEAQLKLAQINLDRTKIYSPIEGVVINRKVDEGQTVAASLQAPELFTIAKDLREMQIDTAVDETDIGVVKEGQKVTFTVDAYKNRNFTGVVHQVRLSPNESSSVVTYSVMVNVDNPDLSLKPGMTANAEILVGEKRDVLRLPIKAMYFKVPDDLREIQNKAMAGKNGKNATDTLPVWLENGKTPGVKVVKMGYSNQSYIELPEGDLKEGDLIITGIRGETNSANGGGMRPGGARIRL